MRIRTPLVVTALVLLVPSLAFALKFPDVPTSNPHRVAVEELSDRGVIGGNPDGTFRPTDPVNRAAMLKMLYIAAKLEPEKVGGCFNDVEQGSWYEYFVCDAAAKGFVQGYAGKLFKPAQAVTRAEAIKLTMVVLGIPSVDASVSTALYTDVGADDWFTGYVRTAIAMKILPISGQEAGIWSPAKILERGEAAAYIWNALTISPAVFADSSSSASALVGNVTGNVSSAEAEIAKRAAAAIRVTEQQQRALELAQTNTRKVVVPFSDKQAFAGKTPFSYEFNIVNPTTVDIQTAIADWNSGSLSCRLYHLGRSGFTQEYYLGFEDEKNCVIRAALSPGDWRLQLEPQQLSPTYTVTVKIVKGDGNDGFSQALTLPLNQVRSDSLDAADLEDWYTFTVPKDARTVEAGGRELVLNVSSADLLGCLIYPLDDVDQYGFKGPDCGYKYLYPPGTYMVGIRHATPLSVRQSYSVQIK